MNTIPSPFKRFDSDNRLAEILKAQNAFFAFSKSQFEDNKQDGIEYVSLMHGMIAPKSNVDNLLSSLELMSQDRITWTLENNTKESIIWYELANHECQITGSYAEIIELLSDYSITEEEIKTEWPKYWDHCVDNDYF